MVIFLFLFFLASPIFAESASMETMWLLDKDKIKVNEIDGLKTYQFAKGFIDFSINLSNDCTRYASISITTTTKAQNDALVGLVSSGKLYRFVDSFSARNSMGELTTKHIHYGFPKEWQNYSVKVTTP